GECAPGARRNEHGAEERDERRAEQHEDRRDREPVDVRGVDHLNCAPTCCAGASPANEWCEMPAGQTESASRIPTSGTSSASSPGRRSSASSCTVGPRASWSTAEISRSMYIAASTTPAAPIAAHH